MPREAGRANHTGAHEEDHRTDPALETEITFRAHIESLRFTDENTEAPRDSVTCARVLRQRLAEPQPKFRFPFLAITRKPTRMSETEGLVPD